MNELTFLVGLANIAFSAIALFLTVYFQKTRAYTINQHFIFWTFLVIQFAWSVCITFFLFIK